MNMFQRKGQMRQFNLKYPVYLLGALIGLCFFSALQAQDAYYYHPVGSKGLTLAGGRTAKINYFYQMDHLKQLKMSLHYTYDTFKLDRTPSKAADTLKLHLGSLNIQLQQRVFSLQQFFVSGVFGGGVYYTRYQNIQENNDKREWQFNAIGGVEAEFFLVRNTLALIGEYNILWMPWHKSLRFLHVPAVGVNIIFH